MGTDTRRPDAPSWAYETLVLSRLSWRDLGRGDLDSAIFAREGKGKGISDQRVKQKTGKGDKLGRRWWNGFEDGVWRNTKDGLYILARVEMYSICIRTTTSHHSLYLRTVPGRTAEVWTLA